MTPPILRVSSDRSDISGRSDHEDPVRSKQRFHFLEDDSEETDGLWDFRNPAMMKNTEGFSHTHIHARDSNVRLRQTKVSEAVPRLLHDGCLLLFFIPADARVKDVQREEEDDDENEEEEERSVTAFSQNLRANEVINRRSKRNTHEKKRGGFAVEEEKRKRRRGRKEQAD